MTKIHPERSALGLLKIITLFIFLLTLFMSLGANTNALGLSQDIEIPYCDGDKCGLKNGKELVLNSNIDGLDTSDKTASDKIQSIVKYLLGFITLIAVIYIIYAGFRILTSSGEDEVIKNSKKTIIYVIVGILVIWFAWAIANFAVSLGQGGEEVNNN